MTRTVFAAALGLVLLIGLAVRLAPLSERRLAPEIRDLGASRWVVDDPGTALHLRRIQLALAEGRVPQHDPFLAHTSMAEIPALPVFDALVAGLAERWLAHPGGDPSLGGVDEADLEAFAAWIGPVAYLFGFAAFVWAAWISARGARVPVVLAALALALAPPAWTVTEVGRLDAAAFVLVLLALLVRGTQIAVRAEDALSTILEALLCGVIAGLLTSMSAAGPLLALPTAAALLLRALRGPLEVRPLAVRAGLLFALVAAFVARLPLADGPWEHKPEGLVARWAFAASDVLLVTAAPFALLLLTAPRGAAHKARSYARLAALAAMLALLVFEIPRAWSAASGPIEAWWGAHSAMPETTGFERIGHFTTLGVVGSTLGAVRLFQDRSAESLHLCVLALTTGVLALASAEFAPLFVLASACALAGSLSTVVDERHQRWWLAAFAVLTTVRAGAHVMARASDSVRENRLAWISALRWIRAEVPPGGPFNSSSSRSSWGILADPRDGELVAYHARRPVLGSTTGAFSRSELASEARHLAESAALAEIVARMRVHGLTLAVARGIDQDPGRIADGSLLAAARDGVETDDLRRIFVSDGSVLLADDARIPAAVIWSLEGPLPPRTPTLNVPR